jgi:cell wall assembly regulator SMI1
MSTSQVAQAWPRIEQWLAAQAPGALASLRPGLRFPDDLVASLEASQRLRT